MSSLPFVRVSFLLLLLTTRSCFRVSALSIPSIDMMLSFATLCLVVSAAVVGATEKVARHHGTNPWLRDFDNLVAFGDRYVTFIKPQRNQR